MGGRARAGAASGGGSLSLLCALMDPRGERGLEWSAEDLAGIARHALRGPAFAAAPGEAAPPPLAAVLAAGPPAEELLLRAKRGVKAAMAAGEEALPREVAKALYAAVIARARAAGLGRVSRLGDAEFARLARWCLAQGWVPGELQELVRQGLGASPGRRPP